MKDIQDVAKFYGEMHEKHGANAKGMGYVSDESHRARLQLVPKVVKLGIGKGALSTSTWLDVGCGIGLLREYLDDAPYVTYTGIDVVDAYIDEAIKTHEYEQTLWHGNFLSMPEDAPPLDHPYMVTSAIGALAWQPATTCLEMLHKMWGLTYRAMIFTALLNRPFPLMQLLNLEKELPGAKGSIIVRGYAPTNEAMIMFIRGG